MMSRAGTSAASSVHMLRNQAAVMRSQAHHWLGRAAVALAVANVFIGLHMSEVRAVTVCAQRFIHLRQLARAHRHLHRADNLHEAQEKHRFWWGYAVVMCADSCPTPRMQPARSHACAFRGLHVQMHA